MIENTLRQLNQFLESHPSLAYVLRSIMHILIGLKVLRFLHAGVKCTEESSSTPEREHRAETFSSRLVSGANPDIKKSTNLNDIMGVVGYVSPVLAFVYGKYRNNSASASKLMWNCAYPTFLAMEGVARTVELGRNVYKKGWNAGTWMTGKHLVVKPRFY